MEQILAFVSEHQAVLSAVGAFILDFILLKNPNWKSNGVVHFIEELLKKKEAPKDEAAK